MRAIVTDANNRIALAVVRSLGSHGIDVACVEQEKFSVNRPLCFYSKYCKNEYVLPDISPANDKFITKLKGTLQKEDVLIPVSTNSVETLCRHASELKNFADFIVPDYEAFALANDKKAIIGFADKLGIPVPSTISVKDDYELKNSAPKIRYPSVIKIRNDSGTDLKPWQKYRIAKNYKELIDFYKLSREITSDLIIQDYIEGQGYGFEAFFDYRGELKAYFCHHRLREYPISGGPSSFCESVKEPQLIDYGIRLLSELKWRGVAMVEFKKDIADNKYKLIEVNPKFWGTLPLAIKCGIDFPFLLYNAALGNEIEIKKEYVQGIKLRFLWLDIPAAFQMLFKRKHKLRILLSVIKDFFDFRITDGILSLDDLKPGIMYLAQRLIKRKKVYKNGI